MNKYTSKHYYNRDMKKFIFARHMVNNQEH